MQFKLGRGLEISFARANPQIGTTARH
jgi:hypothetical protein